MMGATSDIEPRTSMERHLMDRDREGQLYLEARRQQAALDLLKNRSSLLSTITPPSSNPSSAASSLYREPTTTSSSSSSLSRQQQQQQQSQPPSNSVPNTPTSPLASMSSPASSAIIPQPQAQLHTGAQAQKGQGQGQAGASSLAISSSTPYPHTTLPTSNTTPRATTTTTATNNNTTTVLPLPLQTNVVPIVKKTRQRSATTGPGRGRGGERSDFKGTLFPDRSVLAISPSSLEYQLTANLLNYPPPSSSTVAATNTPSSSSSSTAAAAHHQQSQPRSRSRSKSRPQPAPLQLPQPPAIAPPTPKARRHTVNKDARVNTTFLGPSSRGTGHRQQQFPQQQNRHHHHKHNDSHGSNGTTNTTTTTSGNNNNNNNNNHSNKRYNGNSVHQPMTPQEWTPTSLLGSYPPSPTAPCALGPSSSAISDYPYFTAATASATMTPATAAQPKTASVPLPPVPPSPPLPPLPPKSPKTLIAQYFPRSLAPPPSRDRTPYGQRDTVVAPTPFKTPTFGPALVSPTSTTHSDAPPLPSPSASFQYIPTVDISRISTSHALHNNQHHQHLFTEDNSSDFSSSSNRPSPNASLIGFQGSAAPTPPRMMPHQQHPARLPSDLDLILNNSRQRPARLACSTSTLSKQGASSVSSNEGSAAGPMNTTTSAQDEGVAPLPAVATPILLFAPLRPRSPAAGSGIRATPSTTSLSNPHIPPSPTGLPTTPIYPRGLSTPSILGDNAQVIIRLHQKPVPYIRELIPGKETGPAVIASTDGDAAGKRVRPLSTVAFVTTPPSQPASTNTSRDLEMILDEITGRLRTNRTSMDPWAYNLSPWDDKPLPAVRRERGSRFWVFRDQDGLVSGPILFLLGHLFPPLWWVGALYPRLEHPDDIAALESQLARAAEMEAYSAAIGAAAQAQSQTQTHVQEKEGEDDARDHQNGVALQWLQRQLRTLGVTVASITLSSSSSPSKPQPGSSDDENTTIATFQMVQVGESSADDNEREGSTLANISAIHVPYQPPVPTPMPPSILDSRGPWAARGDTSSRASSLFEQRMAHDRKVLRYELDLRWRRINLLWSFVSLLLAICLVAIVLGARK